MTFFGFSERRAESVAAIDDSGQALTYGDLAATSRDLGLVVRSGSICLALARNTTDFMRGCCSLIENHVAPLLVDAAVGDAAVRRYVELYRPEYVLAPREMHDNFHGFQALVQLGRYELLASDAATSDLVHPDLALLLPTSGSTGSPKLVRQSVGNLRANGAAIIEYLGITADDRPITSLPMHYTYGFSVVNSHLLAGATLLLTETSVVEKGFWSFFKDAGATSMAGVPYTFEMLRRLKFPAMDLPTLRTLTQAGGKLAPNIIREFAEYGEQHNVRFFVMYGQTGATARMSYVPADQAASKAGSIGIPIPGGEFFLVDASGALIDEPGLEGELGYRGPNVTMGYAESRADLSLGDVRHGSLLTGDIAYFDEDGYYFITGRNSRFVKLFGKRVSLDDVERLVRDLADEAACVGVDDRVDVWLTDASIAPKVAAHLSAATGVHASAYRATVVEALPRHSSGKVDYAALMKSSRSGEQ